MGASGPRGHRARAEPFVLSRSQLGQGHAGVRAAGCGVGEGSLLPCCYLCNFSVLWDRVSLPLHLPVVFLAQSLELPAHGAEP